MISSDIKALINRGPDLAHEIDRKVPNTVPNLALRADLAGLLIVSISASYESCVKETFLSYSARHNNRFAFFIENNFDKLNSKIQMRDLYKYTKDFGVSINARFKTNLAKNQKTIEAICKKDIIKSYENLLGWRHAFAHAGERKATIKEALDAHNVGRLVIYSFYMAFNED